MKIEMTPEEHARLHRRRGRQALGLVIAVLVLIGTLTVLHAAPYWHIFHLFQIH